MIQEHQADPYPLLDQGLKKYLQALQPRQELPLTLEYPEDPVCKEMHTNIKIIA